MLMRKAIPCSGTSHADRSDGGEFRFVVNTGENGFELSHVHVRVGNEDVCRIELYGGTYMDHPLPGDFRDILRASSKYAGDIRNISDSIHGM